jgi:hypothetical protein
MLAKQPVPLVPTLEEDREPVARWENEGGACPEHVGSSTTRDGYPDRPSLRPCAHGVTESARRG